ncbi:hypothetical protein KHM19_16800 [Leptospira borgpetersenii]|nr:hypothetical protein KHM09_16400 [Leptospira borgpetersenii]GIM22497.1 hypothetical protein KHM19_16800 [Leptospira borgpetersenii]GIM25919.1 hypothetical protein KHM25_18440 [Leptospira borgpetersenii]
MECEGSRKTPTNNKVPKIENEENVLPSLMDPFLKCRRCVGFIMLFEMELVGFSRCILIYSIERIVFFKEVNFRFKTCPKTSDVGTLTRVFQR